MKDLIPNADPIVIIGLGHVGLTLGLALADVGFTVYGFDIKQDVRERTRTKTPHFKEKGLPELLESHVGKRFTVVDSLVGLPTSCVYFVTVGTPFKRDNTPDYTYIQSAAEDIGSVLKKGDIVILRSTVPLGTTRDVVTPLLEKRSGLRAGTDFDVAFAPERTVEGNAFEELRVLPQIIAGFNEKSRIRTEAIFRPLAEKLVLLDTLEEAEIVKLINNTYRETVFAFANQVSMLSRAWKLDTKKVIKAANEGYARSQVPFPSPGVGGYCLTKDAYLFMESARKRQVDTRLLAAVRENTSTMLDVMARDIRAFARAHAGKRQIRIGILGFAFKGKPATSDVRGSTTAALLKRFNYERDTFVFVGYDPQVESDVVQSMGAEPKNSIEEVIQGSDMVIIMNNNTAFAEITPHHFEDKKEMRVFFDTWGICDKEAFKDHSSIQYWSL